MLVPVLINDIVSQRRGAEDTPARHAARLNAARSNGGVGRVGGQVWRGASQSLFFATSLRFLAISVSAMKDYQKQNTTSFSENGTR